MCDKKTVRVIVSSITLDTSMSLSRRVDRPFGNEGVLERSYRMVNTAMRESFNEQRQRIRRQAISTRSMARS